MAIRLLALDMDGTLLDHRLGLLEEDRAAVLRARAAGLEAVLVTGRSWRGASETYEALGMSGPAICYLGALTVGGPNGRVIGYRPMEPAAWQALREFAVSEGLAVTACIGADKEVAAGELPPQDLLAADTAFATCRSADFLPWDDWNPYTELSKDLSGCRVTPVMVAVYGDRAVERVLAEFPQGLPGSQFDLNDRIAGEQVLHVWHESVEKGRALAELCRARGIEPHEVLAIGDAPMDIGMLEFAGIGVAVPHAELRVQAAADWVATVAEAIDRLLKGMR